jgi:putative transposase
VRDQQRIARIGDAARRCGRQPNLAIGSTNPLERLNAEIKRRTNVVGIFPNDAAVTRLVGAMLLEQSDEWSLQRRYMQLEGLQALSDTAAPRLSAVQR